MKCDVLFSQGSVRTIFRWGGHFSYMSKTFLALYNSAKIIKIARDFPKLWSQMYCHLFLWFTVYIRSLCVNQDVVIKGNLAVLDKLLGGRERGPPRPPINPPVGLNDWKTKNYGLDSKPSTGIPCLRRKDAFLNNRCLPYFRSRRSWLDRPKNDLLTSESILILSLSQTAPKFLICWNFGQRFVRYRVGKLLVYDHSRTHAQTTRK